MSLLLPVSVLIPIKNEAANLPRALASVAWADEIIVVDSHSTDASRTIAQQAGAQVVDFDYIPPWPKKKQWALDNLSFRHPWVLILDADEVMPASSQNILADIIARYRPDDPRRIDAYWLNRRFYFLGKPLRHAYTPNWNLRFFRKGSCHFERLSTQETHSGDNEVHEHLICQGATKQLPSIVIDHYAFPTPEIFFEKHLRYSRWEAAVESSERSGGAASELKGAARMRRRLKNLSRKLPFRGFLRFCWIYFGQKAFLDGYHGYLFARFHSIYETLIAAQKLALKSPKP